MSLFKFEAQEIRVVGDPADPLFCAADVCTAMGYGNPREALAKHVDDGDVTKRDATDSTGRTQSMSFVNESGLYALIFGSRLETAKRFKRWVTHEVLPAIRKTGGYSTRAPGPTATPKDLRLAEAERRRTAQALLAIARATKDDAVIREAALKGIAIMTQEMPLTEASASDATLRGSGWLAAAAIGKILSLSPIVVGQIATAIGLKRVIPNQVRLSTQIVDGVERPLWEYRDNALTFLYDIARLWKHEKFSGLAEVEKWGATQYRLYGLPADALLLENN